MSDLNLVPIDAPTMELRHFAGTEGQGRMITLANEFKAMCDQRAQRGDPWLVRIGPGEHPRIEAWQYLGQRAGVTALTDDEKTVEIRHPATGEFEGVRAVAEAVLIQTGQVIGRAVSVCYADEVLKSRRGIYHRWHDEEGKPNRHAITGMAQTRAQSRVLASVLRFLAELAGAQGTPAEDMDGVRPSDSDRSPVRQPEAKPGNGNGGTGGTGGDDGNRAPGDVALETTGLVQKVESSSGSNANGPYTKYGIRLRDGEQDLGWFSTFSVEIAEDARLAHDSGRPVRITYRVKDGKYRNIQTLTPLGEDEAAA